MRLITEAEVAAVLDPDSAVRALRAAFAQHGRGRAQVLARQRATATQGGAALAISAMGAILDADADLPAVLGTKVYSARNGRYHFLVSLFAADSGEALATLQANEFTRLRTAAATAVAADLLALPDARTLAVFGAGIQARAHVEALSRVRRFERVLVCARSGGEALARELQAALRLTVRSAAAAEAAAEADVLVTATRSATPLFDGGLVKAGAFVAAVGSSTPAARELDDALLGRASVVAVEWLPAACQEAGELVQAAPGVVPAERLAELGSLIVEPRPRGPLDIVVYKSVGIGLEDVALARVVARRLGLC
ncbi:MAG: ornithine cyclodeaminase family protein [Roseateles sp.]|jgi:ornithine cyclodeaminase|nr:ornithine cyclodeaminase [Methylibium sp.]